MHNGLELDGLHRELAPIIFLFRFFGLAFQVSLKEKIDMQLWIINNREESEFLENLL